MDESHYLQSPNTQHVLLTDGSSGEDLALLLTGPACTPTPLKTYPTTDALTYNLIMQTDGNLVLYDLTSAPTARFSTGTSGNPGAKAVLQDDRNLVIYSATGTALWSSGTACSSMTAFTAPDNTTSFPDINTATLTGGHYLQSSDRVYKLAMQTDGNLVLYQGSTVKFQTATNGNPGAKAVLQADGNLVIYPTTGPALWHTGTATTTPVHATLTLKTDGHLTLTRNTLTTNTTTQIA